MLVIFNDAKWEQQKVTHHEKGSIKNAAATVVKMLMQVTLGTTWFIIGQERAYNA